MTEPTPPPPPVRKDPVDWEHYELWKRVREAVLALPGYFKTPTTIEGMRVTDIFTLNSALGATIEDQVVKTLNEMRPVWDPDKKYQAYTFVRQPQVFPDVLLRKKTNGQTILMGLELKGWYILSKEGMPNFRFVQSADACNPWDLIVVVPWGLSNILSGSPVAYSPFIDLAKYSAQRRNYYWQHEREAKGEKGITLAKGVTPYPTKSDEIADQAVDKGGNFGRLARYGDMKEFIERTMATGLLGVTADAWLKFLQKHAQEG